MTERPNIRRMQMPERTEKKLSLFDQEVITGDVWNKFNNQFVTDATVNRWKSAVRIGNAMRILRPDADVTFFPALESHVKRELKKKPSLGSLSEDAVRYAQALVFLKGQGMVLAVKEIDWETHFDSIDKWEYRAVNDGADHVRSLFILDPSKDILRSPNVHTKMLGILDTSRGTSQYNVAAYAAALKIMGLPFSELDSSDWKNMHKQLNTYIRVALTEGQPSIAVYQAANMAANMKLLAAEHLEITDKGLEITSPGSARKKTESVPQMPENLLL